jgi:hypothetical protein
MTAPAAEAWRRADRWVTRAHVVGCSCTVDVEPGCGCVCHAPARALLDLARVMRTVRRGPVSGPRVKVEEYATIPPGLTLGDGLLRTVRCHVCGSVLRPGRPGPVTRERAGRWRHGRASGSCGAVAKVPRGGRTLEKLLRGSVVEVSRG